MRLIWDEWQKEILNVKGSIILCSGRQVGKSSIIAARDSERAVKNSNESILIISKTERQAEQLFIKVLSYLEENYPKMIARGKDKPTKHMVKLINNSVIRCFPTGLAGEGIRGFTLTKITADEAALIGEEVYNAVFPSLLIKGIDMDLLGTPHGAKGFFYECHKNVNNEFKVFHVNSEEVINNRKLSATWLQKDRDNALKHLEIAKQRMSSREYAQEYMGEFVRDFMQFFSDGLIKNCMNNKRGEFSRKGNYYLGVDVARMGDDECVFSIINKISRNKLIHVENIIMAKVYLNEVANKIIELDKQYNFCNIYIDSGGIGVGVSDYLLEHEQTKRKTIEINNRTRVTNYDDERKVKLLKEDLYNNLLGLMERGEISLLQDDELELSFKSVQYEYLTTAKSLTKLRIFGSYTHCVEALIRACWCVKDKHLNIWCR